jgi:hypothetical protein
VTTTAMQPIALPSPSRVGQATAIEQSRAVAEVHAAIFVAQQFPRNVETAIRAMRESCRQPALADRAFFRFPRGKDDQGKTKYVTGASVHLARELARTWGNVQYGIAELARDDKAGQSEMIAFAWDVQTNTRASTAFITPHRRDTKNGVVDLTDMREVYENNANHGARRVREMIFAVLPAWFTEEAKAICNDTIVSGGGKPLAQRVIEAIDGFADMGIAKAQLIAKIGTDSADWTPQDVAQLGVIWTSLRNGEVTKDEEFPVAAPDRVTADEVRNGGGKPAEAKPQGGRRGQAVAAQDRGARPPAKAASGQVSMIEDHWKRLGYEDHEAEEVLAETARIAGAGTLGAFTELTQEQAKAVQDALGRFKDRPSLVAWLHPAEPGDAS